MSTDFFINKEQMEAKGLIEYIATEDDGSQVVQFKNYEYLRSCEVNNQNSPLTLYVSGGGAFRSWLHRQLKENNISYEYF